MKRLTYFSFLALFSFFLLSSCQKDNSLTVMNDEITPETDWVNGQVIPDQYIVVFNASSVNLKSASTYKERLSEMQSDVNDFLGSLNLTKSETTVDHVFGKAIYGFSVKTSAQNIEKIKADNRVAWVEKDKMLVLAKGGKPSGGSAAQVTPWGISRVNGGVDATGKVAWIIDTGVDFDHEDLNVDVARSKTFVRSKSANDDNGHGSHCAGTIAAKNNAVGVIGVAANATVVAVKVLDRKGSGAYSAVISGVDYVAANAKAGDAANMSLGGPVSDALDQAILNAAATGVKFALAAGNESADANNSSPSRINANNIYTISAMDNKDAFAYFSNFGNPPVDYCEPGVDIYSTYKDGGYATLSGTSMATPHFTGLLLLGAIRTDGFVNGDPDGNPDPIGVH